MEIKDPFSGLQSDLILLIAPLPPQPIVLREPDSRVTIDNIQTGRPCSLPPSLNSHFSSGSRALSILALYAVVTS